MNNTELRSEVLETADAAVTPRKKELYALPLSAILIIFVLLGLLLAACIVNALTIGRLQERTEALENQLLLAEGELAEAQGRLEIAQAAADEADSKVAAAPVNYDEILRAVAHRGFSAAAPENTLPAFRLAKERGFSYVETDVQFTADGYAVCLHDQYIDRVSNGSGTIDSMSLEEVRQYDFGAWKGADYAGTRIPTLEEFLELCRNLELHPYIEMKPETVTGEVRARQLAQIVEACGMKGKVTWISFSHYLLSVMRDCDPEAPLGYLVDDADVNAVAMANTLRNGHNRVFLDAGSYTDELCQICADNDMPLEIWTVDKEEQILNLNPYITGVTSNRLVAGKVRYEAYTGQN